MKKIIIIGAGPTGLGAAHRLNQLGGVEWRVYERHSSVGGLSASVVDDKRFTWDVGGHVLFSHYSHFDNVVHDALNGSYYEHVRESWIRTLGTWVPYPFQNNIRHLPEEQMKECLEGLRRLPEIGPRSSPNFLEWMQAIFGNGIVKHFMRPYNEKVWGVPLDKMSSKWIGERVSIVDRSRIEKNIAEGRDDVSWGPNNKFKFPHRGGTGAIFEGIARPFRDRIACNKELLRIDLAQKELVFTDGQRERYDILINTSPLDAFVRSCSSVPMSVRSAAGDLLYNSGLIVGIGIEGRRVDPKCWMYFPGCDSPFYRTTNFFNYSPYNVPEGRTDRFFSLMCETTYSSFKSVDKNSIVEQTIQGLVDTGLLSAVERSQVVSRYVLDVPYSYPVPTIERDAALAVIQPFLEENAIYSRGRFGAWKYEVGNMDHSFMQGVEIVDRILNGRDERTVNGVVGRE